MVWSRMHAIGETECNQTWSLYLRGIRRERRDGGEGDTNTHKHKISYFKSMLTFLGHTKLWSCLSPDPQNLKNSCDFFIIKIIIIRIVLTHSLCWFSTHCSTHIYKHPVNFSSCGKNNFFPQVFFFLPFPTLVPDQVSNWTDNSSILSDLAGDRHNHLTRKWFPLQGELAQSFKKFYVRTLYKNKIERRKRRKQNKNRPTIYHKVITLSIY